MHQKAKTGKHQRKKDMHYIRSEAFYSVEFTVNGIPFLFQFKIRNTASKPMFILVKQSSDIMNRLNEGDIIIMKYYSSASKYPKELETEIQYITKEDHGRFKGHYLVGLKVLQGQES